MKKRMVQSVLFLFIMGFVLMSFSEASETSEGKRNSNVRYFSKDSVYVYAMGSTNRLNPDFGNYALGMDSASTLAPVVGLGWRMINFSNRFFFNLEFDYTPAKFDFFSRSNQHIDFYTLMLDAELKIFRRNPASIFFGMGASLVSLHEPYRGNDGYGYYYYGTDSTVAMALELGAKFPLTRKLFFRSGIRVYGKVTPSYDYEYDYWDDEYDDDSDFDAFSTSFSLGLEYHF